MHPSALEQLELEQREELVKSALRRIPEKYRIALVLHYYEDFGVQEIAEEISLSVSNVKQRLSRGRKMFSTEYRRLSGGEM